MLVESRAAAVAVVRAVTAEARVEVEVQLDPGGAGGGDDGAYDVGCPRPSLWATETDIAKALAVSARLQPVALTFECRSRAQAFDLAPDAEADPAVPAAFLGRLRPSGKRSAFTKSQSPRQSFQLLSASEGPNQPASRVHNSRPRFAGRIYVVEEDTFGDLGVRVREPVVPLHR